ncbi:MAG: hypothetical protein AB7F75_00620 [Planctomycetota bacterium]
MTNHLNTRNSVLRRRLTPALLVLFLAGCLDSGYSEEAMIKAIREAQLPMNSLPAVDNAALRLKALAEKVTPFPDHLNAGDQICLQGFPKRKEHFIQWLEQNRDALEGLEKAVLSKGYALRADDLDDPERPDGLMKLSYLLLVDAANEEVQGRLEQSARRCLQALRLATILASDGLLNDAKLAHLIQQRAYHLFNRIAPKMSERVLQECIVELSWSAATLAKPSLAHGRMARYLDLRTLQWLAPNPEDSMADRMSQPSYPSLLSKGREILDSQRSLMERPLHELLHDRSWSAFSAKWKGSAEFCEEYFGLGKGYPTGLQFQLIDAWMRMRLELMQLHAQTLVFVRFNRKEWPTSFKELKDNTILCQQTCGKGRTVTVPGQLTDPFTGGDYGFRIDGDRLVLWCVGPDLEDNAGMEIWDDVQARGDFVLEIRRPS